MNLNPSGASPATAAKSGGSHRDSEKSSKRMQLDFGKFKKVDDAWMDAEFAVDADDDATTVKLRHELATAAQPTSGTGAVLSMPPSSSATGFAVPVSATRSGAPPASSGANAADPFADGSAEHAGGNISAAHGSTQAAASTVNVPGSETETLATVNCLPQTEVVDTQMLEDAPPQQMTAPAVQLLSPSAAELPLAPDEHMQEAQELMQPPSTTPAAGQGVGTTLPRSVMSGEEPVELAAALTVTPAAFTVEEEERLAVGAPHVRIPSPLVQPASGVATLGAAQGEEPVQAVALQPSATLSALDLASPPSRAALLRPFEFAANASFQQSPEQLAAMSAPAPLPVKQPPSGPAQLSARVELRVEPTAGVRAEPELQDAAAPQADSPRSLEQMSAELKQLLSNARGQQLRTQQLLNEIVMLASPIHHHKLAERQKKVEEEHQALVAMEQELEPQ